MAEWMRRHSRQVGVGILVLVGVALGIVALRFTASEADAGMPEAQQAYWSWVGTINQGKAAAWASGIELLTSHPELNALYLRLADLCLEVDAVAACRETMATIQPAHAQASLYRETALVRLMDPKTKTGPLSAGKR